MRLNDHIWAVVTRQQPDNELVAEANFTGVEEVLEGDNKFAKYLVDQLDLHFGSQLLV